MTRIMVFGTFDLLHEGHLHFFKQAKTLGPDSFLVVSVGRDKVVARIKGRVPQQDEGARLRQVQACGLADKVVLGDLEGYMEHIIHEQPDIIALGYDQRGEFVDGLEGKLDAAGLQTKVVRLLPHEPERYKSSLLKHSGV